MAYYIDLEKISICEYKAKLKAAYLPPSRQILKENLDVRFDYFTTIGISNVKELLQFLKQKNIHEVVANQDCFANNYIPILLREIQSSLPKPNKLADFSNILQTTVKKLEDVGIKNTEKLYDKVVTKHKRKILAESTGIEYSEIEKLTKLTDLSRIKWVGVTFAQMLYDIQVDTAEKVAKSSPEVLHTTINQLNTLKTHIGLNDISICIQAANDIPHEIEW